LAGAGGLGAPPGRVVFSPFDILLIRWNTHDINIGRFQPKTRGPLRVSQDQKGR
jgi:hypothetical protein